MKNIDTHKTWQLLGTPYRPEKYSLMDKLVLGNKINFKRERGIMQGIVTMISLKGVNCYTDTVIFVKWCNVLRVVE